MTMLALGVEEVVRIDVCRAHPWQLPMLRGLLLCLSRIVVVSTEDHMKSLRLLSRLSFTKLQATKYPIQVLVVPTFFSSRQYPPRHKNSVLQMESALRALMAHLHAATESVSVRPRLPRISARLVLLASRLAIRCVALHEETIGMRRVRPKIGAGAPSVRKTANTVCSFVSGVH